MIRDPEKQSKECWFRSVRKYSWTRNCYFDERGLASMRRAKKSLSAILMTGKAIRLTIFRAGIHDCCMTPHKSDRCLPRMGWHRPAFLTACLVASFVCAPLTRSTREGAKLAQAESVDSALHQLDSCQSHSQSRPSFSIFLCPGEHPAQCMITR
jgi:hypothetical protein